MDYSQVVEVINRYGLVIIFVLGVAEYMNLPGMPATPILMGIGVWGDLNSTITLSIVASIIGGLVGTILLYSIGYLFGHPLLKLHRRYFPKSSERLDEYVEHLSNGRLHYIFYARLIPVLRTLIGIPAGALAIDFRSYCMYSLFGITVWNTLFIIAGVLSAQLFSALTQ